MKKTIFCDAYGTQVPTRECKRCPLKQNCTKIKLINFGISKYMIPRYSYK
jgi:hypothetical protein